MAKVKMLKGGHFMSNNIKLIFTYSNGKKFHANHVIDANVGRDSIVYTTEGEQRKRVIDGSIVANEVINAHYKVPTHDLAGVTIIRQREEDGVQDVYCRSYRPCGKIKASVEKV